MNPAHVGHLARRFFGSLRPGPPSPTDEAWAIAHLNPGQEALWRRLSNPDRRHGVEVARAVIDELGERATDPVVAAALLHDSGKVVSGFGTFSRVAATLVWGVIDHAKADEWQHHDRALLRRLGQYRLHPELGGDLLEKASSDPLTVAWAREHHQPVERWTIDREIGAVLKACDDD